MGFLGKVISGAAKFIAPLAQSAIKAIAPKAIDTLKNIVGSGFDSLVGGAKNLLGQLPIVGPLASGLVDKLAPGLKNLGLGALEKGLTGLVEKFTGTNIGGQNVVAGTLAERGAASVAAAATAAGAGVASTAAAATAVSGGAADSAFSGLGATGGNVNGTPNADKQISEAGLDPNSKEAKQLRAQERATNIAQAFAMISQMLQLQRQTLQTITQNIR